ncbi:hypothetical protein B0H14DRAFT_2688748 [Mycena olivaceomarginata]|nr:hypothetical protein B0H14DRAFT_2688748 [Mycena olivaceomarginata]
MLSRHLLIKALHISFCFPSHAMRRFHLSFGNTYTVNLFVGEGTPVYVPPTSRPPRRATRPCPWSHPRRPPHRRATRGRLPVQRPGPRPGPLHQQASPARALPTIGLQVHDRPPAVHRAARARGCASPTGVRATARRRRRPVSPSRLGEVRLL